MHVKQNFNERKGVNEKMRKRSKKCISMILSSVMAVSLLLGATVPVSAAEEKLTLTADNVGVYIAALDARLYSADNTSGPYNVINITEKRATDADPNANLFDGASDTTVTYGNTRCVVIDTGITDNSISKVEVHNVSASATFATSDQEPPVASDAAASRFEAVTYTFDKAIRMNVAASMKDGYNIKASNVDRGDTVVTISGIDFGRYIILDSARTAFTVGDVVVYVADATTALANTKNNAKTELASYLPKGITQERYTTENWELVEQARTDGAIAIDAAENEAAVATALATAKATIDSIETISEEETGLLTLTADRVGVYIVGKDVRTYSEDNTTGPYNVMQITEKRAASADQNGNLFDGNSSTTVTYGDTRCVIIDTGITDGSISKVEVHNVSASATFATSNQEPPVASDTAASRFEAVTYTFDKAIRMNTAANMKDGYNISTSNVDRGDTVVTISGIDFGRYIIIDSARSVFSVGEVKVYLTEKDTVLEQAKTEAKEELGSYLPEGKTQDSYTIENWALVEQARAHGAIAIDAAESEVAVATALATAKATIDSIETISEEETGLLTLTASNVGVYIVAMDARSHSADNTSGPYNVMNITEKRAASADPNANLFDGNASTTVTYGNTRCVIIDTGADTKIGKVEVHNVSATTTFATSDEEPPVASDTAASRFEAVTYTFDKAIRMNTAANMKDGYNISTSNVDRGDTVVTISGIDFGRYIILDSARTAFSVGEVKVYLLDEDEALEQAKKTAKEELASYLPEGKTQDSYTTENWALVEQARANGSTAIDAAEDEVAIEAALATAKAVIDAIETIVVPSVEYKLGDVNNDNAITLADALLALNITVKDITDQEKAEQPYLSADVDKDGNVTVQDVLKILQKSNGKEVADVDWLASNK